MNLVSLNHLLRRFHLPWASIRALTQWQRWAFHACVHRQPDSGAKTVFCIFMAGFTTGKGSFPGLRRQWRGWSGSTKVASAQHEVFKTQILLWYTHFAVNQIIRPWWQATFGWLTITSSGAPHCKVPLNSTWVYEANHIQSGCDFISRAIKVKLPPTQYRKTWILL